MKRKAIALAILALFLAVLWLGVVSPIASQWLEDRQEIAKLTRVLTALRSKTASIPDLKAQLSSTKERAASSQLLLQGQVPAQAAAKLQGDLQRIVEANFGQVKSVQAMAPASEGGLLRVGVRLQLTSDMAGLQKTIYQIESSPILFVDNLDVRSSQAEALSVNPSRPTPLDVSVEVFGYMRGVS